LGRAGHDLILLGGLGWLPSSGSGTPLLIMPAFALGWYFAAPHGD
jgi:hypothetical protein